MIGWMQNWDTYSVRMDNSKWFGQMSLPRELSIKKDRLIQWPIREIEQLRSNTVEVKEVLFSGKECFEGIRGRKIDMEVEIFAQNPEKSFHKFTICFAQNEEFYSEIVYQPSESVVEMSRQYSGNRRAGIHQRKCHVNTIDGRIKMRLILDRYSAEVFINGSEQVMTMTIYTNQDADEISFIADGDVKLSIKKSDLEI
jgi:sucrose-6-phosphate hydrolase SacC (GH32 family)